MNGSRRSTGQGRREVMDKSRYELFLEDEARKAEPTKRKRNRPRKFKDWTDRFWKMYWTKVVPVGDCLEWTGACRAGIPYVQRNKKGEHVRRVVYQLAIGQIEEGMYIFVTCKNRP